MAEAPAPHAESGNSPSVCSDQKAGQSKRPTCILVLGMAGSGKTTFVQVLQTSNDLQSSVVVIFSNSSVHTETLSNILFMSLVHKTIWILNQNMSALLYL